MEFTPHSTVLRKITSCYEKTLQFTALRFLSLVAMYFPSRVVAYRFAHL